MAEKSVLKFVRLSDNAFIPVHGSEFAAGLDLKSAYDYNVLQRGKILAKTDIQIALPMGCYGRIAPRSGLALQNIHIGAGVIDQDYRGNVCVLMFNFGDNVFSVKKGDKIAQLILEQIFIPELQEVEQLDKTVRGDKGFGSTG